MKTKYSKGFHLLLLHVFLFFGFFIWVLTPKWYNDIGHLTHIRWEIEDGLKLNEEQKKDYQIYLEKMKEIYQIP